MATVDFKPRKVLITRLTCDSVDGKTSGGRASCFYCSSSPTPGAGCADNYFCNHPSLSQPKKVMHYVEYSSDWNPVPDWCPLLVDDDVAETLLPENEDKQRKFRI